MATALERLASVASPALGEPLPSEPPLLRDTGLTPLLSRRNGFYAFESALHVFPASQSGHVSIEEWNAQELWRFAFDEDAAGLLFFAEDIFGEQFAVKQGGVWTFNPETSVATILARDIDGWAEAILSRYDELTGYTFAHEWQTAHGSLVPGTRLLPKIPFVLGGEYTLENLYVSDAAEGMRARGSMARQIRNLPDGTTIRLRVVE